MRWIILLLFVAGCAAQPDITAEAEVVKVETTQPKLPDVNVGPDPEHFDYVAETGEINPVENELPIDEWCKEGEKWHYFFEEEIVAEIIGPAEYEGQEFCKAVEDKVLDVTYYFSYGDKEVWIDGLSLTHIVDGEVI